MRPKPATRCASSASASGRTPVEHLDSLGLLGPKDDPGPLRPCVTDGDVATLARSGVTVSHNPQSNMKISSGVAPVAQMLRAGVTVTVATDGPCSNNDLDMWEELRTAAFLQKSATGDPCAAGVGGPAAGDGQRRPARWVAPRGELGVLREGALADLIVVDLRKPHLQPLHDVVSNLAYCGGRRTSRR